MNDIETVRDLLAQADRAKRMSEAAESVRRHIRLQHPIAVRRGLLGKLKWTNEPKGHYEFEELPGDLTAAVYDALTAVMRSARESAADLEQQAVSVKAAR